MIFRKPVDKEGGEKIVTVVWPTHYCFPRQGGIGQQSFLSMRLFAAALRGEQRACSRIMAK